MEILLSENCIEPLERSAVAGSHFRQTFHQVDRVNFIFPVRHSTDEQQKLRRFSIVGRQDQFLMKIARIESSSFAGMQAYRMLIMLAITAFHRFTGRFVSWRRIV
ncbi:hypothetical protein [Lacunimicrobium album]